MGKHEVISKTGSAYNVRIATPREEDRATAIRNVRKNLKLGPVARGQTHTETRSD